MKELYVDLLWTFAWSWQILHICGLWSGQTGNEPGFRTTYRLPV